MATAGALRRLRALPISASRSTWLEAARVARQLGSAGGGTMSMMTEVVGAKRRFVSTTLNAGGQPEVALERLGSEGGVARLTLNKPERLNALSHSMIRGMDEALEKHFGKFPDHPGTDNDRTQQAVMKEDAKRADGAAARLLVLRGAGGKAFCAGGDVKSIAQGGSLGPGVPGSITSDFFRDEYLLDYRLATIARHRTLLSLWDGVVMGGGVGISINGTFRVATETTLFAMPETVIGLFPDVGAAYALSRLPGGLGQYLGLTGARLRGDDLLYCGLATHFVQRDRLPDLEDALARDDGRDPSSVLERFASEVSDPQSSMIAKNKRWIDEAFSGARSVEEIIRRLEARAAKGSSEVSAGNSSREADDSATREWARGALDSLAKASPTSLKVTHRHIHWAASATLRETFQQDFRLVQNLMTVPDFAEGVRALLVDKDNAPKWAPETLEGVSDPATEALFAGLGEHELVIL